jgi:hypothetical protein
MDDPIIERARERLLKQAVEEIDLEENGNSLVFLQAVYRCTALPLATRMRAASMALPFEHPKLGVSVNINDDGTFAARLDQAIQRSQNGHAKVEGPKVIEHSALELRQTPAMSGHIKRRI